MNPIQTVQLGFCYFHRVLSGAFRLYMMKNFYVNDSRSFLSKMFDKFPLFKSFPPNDQTLQEKKSLSFLLSLSLILLTTTTTPLVSSASDGPTAPSAFTPNQHIRPHAPLQPVASGIMVSSRLTNPCRHCPLLLRSPCQQRMLL